MRREEGKGYEPPGVVLFVLQAGAMLALARPMNGVQARIRGSSEWTQSEDNYLGAVRGNH